MHTVWFHHGWWLGFTWVEHKQIIQVMERFHILVVVVVTKVYKSTETLEWVHFIMQLNTTVKLIYFLFLKELIPSFL